MKSKLLNDIRQAVNREMCRKALKSYFESKGLTTPDSLVIPSVITDISLGVPEFGNRIEVVGVNENYDPFTGVAVVGWNLYVNGTERMSLGKTTHNRVGDLVSGTIPEHAHLAEPERTVREICRFIMKTLSSYEGGFDRLPPNTRVMAPNAGGLRTMSGQDTSLTRSFINLP